MKPDISFSWFSSHVAKRVLVVLLLLCLSGGISLKNAVAAPEVQTNAEATVAKNEAKTFLEAVKNNDLEEVTKMLARDKTLASRTNIGIELPLSLAIRNNHTAIVKLLLQSGADANKSDSVTGLFAPLGQAVSSGNLEIVRLLLDAGADVNKSIASPARYNPSSSSLTLAIDKADKRFDILKLMLATKPDLNHAVGGETPVHRAIIRGFLNALAALVEAGAPLDERDHRGNTLLMQAVSQSDAKLEVAKLLVEHGAAVNVANKLGETPLHLAVNNNDIVKFLISKGANTNAVTRSGDTPAHSAAKAGAKFSDLVKSANADARNQSGDTPLSIAIRLNSPDTQILLSKNHLRNRDGFNRTPLLLALTYVQKSELSVVLNRFQTTNALSKNAVAMDSTEKLFLAVAQNDVKTLAKLLTPTSSTRLIYTHLQDGTTLLHIAAMWQSPATLKILLERGADVNATDAKGETPLYKVVRHLRLQDENGNAQLGNNALAQTMISQLLIHGADINRRLFTRDEYRGNTALHLAVQSRNTKLVSFLLDNGAHLGILDEQGHTSLQRLYSAIYSQDDAIKVEAITEILLKRGAKINDADDNGNTLLHHAIEAHNLRLIKFLLAKGADANARNFNGQTPLARLLDNAFTAELARPLLENGAQVKGINSMNGNEFLRMLLSPVDASFVKLMIFKGFDINARNDSYIGETPLIYVVSGFHTENTQALLNNGADIDAFDKVGFTALMRAVMRNDKYFDLAAVKLLIERGADKNLLNKDGKTALDFAIECKNFQAIELLQSTDKS